ncbi:MAG: elongation factor 1-beta [Nanobdellota archaeon]
MANAVVTFKIMPDSPEIDLEKIKEKALEMVKEKGAKGQIQAKIEPVAFGLKQLLIMAMYEVSDDNDFDAIAEEMGKIEGVQSSEVQNMDLAMG